MNITQVNTQIPTHLLASETVVLAPLTTLLEQAPQSASPPPVPTDTLQAVSTQSSVLHQLDLQLQQLPDLEQALEIAQRHPGAEAISRNSDGSYNLYPFQDERINAAQAQDFSGFAQHIVAVSLEDGRWIQAGHPVTHRVLERSRQMLDNLQDNRYVLGGQNIDFDQGIVHTDCSGLIRALWGEQGVALTGKNAALLTDHLSEIGSPFERVYMAKALQPGDLIGIKMPDIPHVSGHMMMVYGEPEVIKENGQVLGYNLPVLDATSLPHGPFDTRTSEGGTGLGYVSIKIDPQTHEIQRLYWQVDFLGDSWEAIAGRFHGRNFE